MIGEYVNTGSYVEGRELQSDLQYQAHSVQDCSTGTNGKDRDINGNSATPAVMYTSVAYTICIYLFAYNGHFWVQRNCWSKSA